MDKKTYTVLITSNRHGGTWSLALPAAWLKAFGFVGFVGLIIALAMAVDYMGLLFQAAENKRLRAENALLKKQFDVVESKLSSLESGLERVQSFTKKLKLITNVEDDDRVLKLSMGSAPRAGRELPPYAEEGFQAPASEDRSPAALGAAFAREPILIDRLKPDGDKGELSYRNDLKDYATLSIRIDRAVRETQMREQGVIQLWESLSERQSLLNATPNIKPARGWFTSRFGYRIDPFTGRPEMHAGLDIAGPPGTPIYAPADGIVSHVGFESGYGKLVSIDHGYGVITRYAHNSRIFVEQGQKVKRWDVISAIGSTGRSSGPHLHYEVRIHGVPVDPMNYILDE